MSPVHTPLPRRRASWIRSVVSAPVLIWTKWTSGGESIPASSIARRTPSAATLACTAVPNSSGSRSRMSAVPAVKRFCPGGAPGSGPRVKIVAGGLMTPSAPPAQMIGTCGATSSSFRPERSAMSMRKDSVASARVKSLTPPLPSVLPRTATTCSARKAPASSSRAASLMSSGARIPTLNAWRYIRDLLSVSGPERPGRRIVLGLSAGPASRLDQRQQPGRVEGHLANADAERRQRIVDGFGDHRGPGDRSAFADAFGPERVERRGRLRVADLDGGNLHRGRDQEVHEGRGEWLAASVIDDSLVEGATDPLGDTTADLPLDDHRIHHGPAVVLDHIAEDPEVARGDVDLNDGRVAAAGERGLRRGVVPEGLEPRLLALGQDGARPRLDQAERGLGCLLPVCVANGVGHRGQRAEREPAAGHAPDAHHAIAELQVVRRGLEQLSRDAERFVAHLRCRRVDRSAAHDQRAARIGAGAPVEAPRVTRYHRHRRGIAAQNLGGDLGERRRVPLALRREAARDEDLAARFHPDVRTLVRTDAGPLDVAADAKTEVAPARPGVGLPGPEVAVADHVEGHLEPRRVVAAVVARGPAVLESETDVPWELVRPDEVAASHLEGLDAELPRDEADHPLHHERAVRTPGPAVGADGGLVGVGHVELDVVVAQPVRSRELSGRDERDDDAVGGVGPRVVHEPVAQAEDAAVPVDRDLDVVELAALLVRGEQVLATVLGPLHGPGEPDGGERHEDLLREEEHDLGPEAPADVGRDHLDVELGEPEDPRQAVLHGKRRLRRAPHPEGAAARVPLGDDAPRLDRASAAPLDREPLA